MKTILASSFELIKTLDLSQSLTKNITKGVYSDKKNYYYGVTGGGEIFSVNVTKNV